MEYLKIAADRHSSGDLEGAVEILSDAAIIEPNNIMIWHGLGDVLLQLNEKIEAINCFEQVLRLAPSSAAALNDLGFAYIENDNFEFALPYLEEAHNRDENNTTYIANLSRCYIELQRFNDANIILKRATERKEPDKEILRIYGENLAILGEIEAARSIFEQFSDDQNYRALGLFALSNLEKQSKENGLLQRIEHALNQTIQADQRRLLHQGAAKCLIESGNAIEGFRHVMAGKSEKTHTFDRNDFESLLIRIKDADMIPKPESPPSEERPIFIVGMPRCGSSLLEKYLSGHPQLHGAGERRHMPRIALLLGMHNREDETFCSTLRSLSSDELRGIAQGYISIIQTRNVQKNVLYIDKMLHNFLNIGLIMRLFPNARIIHARRHPFDACVAIYTSALSGKMHPYAEQLDDLGWYYKKYLKLMEYWQLQYPESIINLRYEDIVENPRIQINRITDFLNISFDESMLDHTKNSHVTSTMSKWQIHQPIYKSSVSRWKNFESLITPITDQLYEEANTYENKYL